jgi:alpha-mannosidase
MPHHPDQRRRELAALGDRVREAVYTTVADLEVTAWVTPEPMPFSRREEGERKDLRPGDKWGGLFDCAWFRFVGRIPAEAHGKRVVLLADVNGEALVVDAEGRSVLGLTAVSSGYDYSLGRPGKRVVPVADPATGGAAIEVWADAGCNDLFGELREDGALKEAVIAVCHPDLLALGYDWEVLLELMRELPEQSAQRHSILAALDRAAVGLRGLSDDEARAAREVLAPELARRGGDTALSISAIGHAHMDLAWLWPIRETIRKGARTFATALRMMERYPTYHFGASQPQLYQWMKEHYPSLYAEVRERIREGRWEAQGAMWVEADTNVPGGEALVRQVLYGKRFFREEFGVDPRVLWLPDVFGYSAALPQILRQAGVDWFMTQKLSWNTVNRFPYHTFRWQGLDGSEVLAHMLPEETYNSSAAPRALAKAEHNFAEKGRSPECLLLFGIGDGGGGPWEEHIERLLREGNLAGLPPVRQEPSERFFERIAADAESLPRWVGELYLERHQGTYTTQARSKRCNRKMEIALREAEWACVRATVLLGDAYPSDRLEAIWKEMLLYQFHDILPGSSITRVYDESLARYDVLLTETEEITSRAEGRLASEINTRACADPVIVWNSLSWERDEWLGIDGRWRHVTVPPMGYAVVDTAPQVARAIEEATTEQRQFIDLTAADVADPYEVVKRLQEDPETRGTPVAMRVDFDAIKRLKADRETRDIPIIMLTAKTRDPGVLRGWQAGFDSYLDEVISPPRQSASWEVLTPPTASERVLENELLRVEFAVDGSVVSLFDKEARREAIAPGSAGNRLALYADDGDA